MAIQLAACNAAAPAETKKQAAETTAAETEAVTLEKQAPGSNEAGSPQ